MDGIAKAGSADCCDARSCSITVGYNCARTGIDVGCHWVRWAYAVGGLAISIEAILCYEARNASV